MQNAPKAVWSIPYVSVAFFPSLKQKFSAYCFSKVSSHPDCIFEIYQLWQSGFSRVYSNSWCSCSFGAEIIKIGQSSHKMYSNNILSFQESTTILNARTKKVWKLIECTTYIYWVLWQPISVCEYIPKKSVCLCWDDDRLEINYPTDVKSARFQFQLEAPHMSSHTEQLWY